MSHSSPAHPLDHHKTPLAARLGATALGVALLAVASFGLVTAQAQEGGKDTSKDAKPKDGKAVAAPKPALTVTVAAALRQEVPLNLSATGSVAPWQELSVSTETNGLRLTELRANVGDFVKKGQVLATFSAETLQADLAGAKAALAEAQASAAEARSNAERARGLASSGALSSQQIQQMLTAEQATQARVEAVSASLKSQQLRLRQASVTAPDSGVVTVRPGTVGAVLPAGFELFRLIRNGRLEWRGEVTATELGRIKPGQTVLVSNASASTAEPGQAVVGKVRLVAPTVDPQTRNALVYVDLPSTAASESNPLKAGMFARGQFEVGSASALTLPASAVVLRDGFSTVMRLDANNQVRQVKVQLGRRSAERLEITEGIAPGQQFVVSGASFLGDGDTVRVVAAAAAASAAATKP